MERVTLSRYGNTVPNFCYRFPYPSIATIVSRLESSARLTGTRKQEDDKSARARGQSKSRIAYELPRTTGCRYFFFPVERLQ